MYPLKPDYTSIICSPPGYRIRNGYRMYNGEGGGGRDQGQEEKPVMEMRGRWRWTHRDEACMSEWKRTVIGLPDGADEISVDYCEKNQ